MDMTELTEENLELELRFSKDGNEGKSVPLSKLKPVSDALTWARSFCLYVGIVVSAHPSNAWDLLAYLATMLAGVTGGGLMTAGFISNSQHSSWQSLGSWTRHCSREQFFLRVAQETVSGVALSPRWRAGIPNQRRGASWPPVLHGAMGKVVWPHCAATPMCARDAVGSIRRPRAHLPWRTHQFLSAALEGRVCRTELTFTLIVYHVYGLCIVTNMYQI